MITLFSYQHPVTSCHRRKCSLRSLPQLDVKIFRSSSWKVCSNCCVTTSCVNSLRPKLAIRQSVVHDWVKKRKYFRECHVIWNEKEKRLLLIPTCFVTQSKETAELAITSLQVVCLKYSDRSENHLFVSQSSSSCLNTERSYITRLRPGVQPVNHKSQRTTNAPIWLAYSLTFNFSALQVCHKNSGERLV